MSNLLDEVVRAGLILSKGSDVREFIASLIDQLFDLTAAHIGCFFSLGKTDISLLYRKGRYRVRESFTPHDEPFQFVLESKETVVLTERNETPFLPLLLHRSMQSGIVAPFGTQDKTHGFIVLNARESRFFVRNRLRLIEVITRIAGEYFHTSLLHNRLKEYARRIDRLERYQENILSSMTELILAADTKGDLKYFNQIAGLRFSLTNKDLDRNIMEIFHKKIDKNLLEHVQTSVVKGGGIFGAEGSYRGEKEMHFSLNASPLFSREGKREGLTLVFSEQGREGKAKREAKKAQG